MDNERIWTIVSRKLSGEATDSELSELNDCLKSQAGNALYLQAIDEFWQMPIEKDDEFLEATYQLHLNRLKEKGFDLESVKERDENNALYIDSQEQSSNRPGQKKRFLAMAVLSVLATLYFSIFHFNDHKKTVIPPVAKPAQSEVSTRSGSRTRIRLPDGSTVWLNANSKLVYDIRHFGEKLREVTLTGEAYFDIANNSAKPFIIHTGRITIRVTGTAFNIKAYPGDKHTETCLVRGSLEITMKDREGIVKLKPSEKLIIRNETYAAANENRFHSKPGSIVKDPFLSFGRITIANDDNTVVETAWVENKLIFDKETFEEVSRKMERWYGVNIHFMDDRLKLQRLTGSFEKETLAEALQALQIATPIFNYHINNQDITILKR